MTLYAESSAVIAWLLGEPAGPVAADTMRGADAVITSELTLIECDRALLRARALPATSLDHLAVARGILAHEAARWSLMPVSADVVARARAPFPDDGIRALDAIHLATAVVAASATGPLDILSLDDRVRRNATALGFRVIPD